LDSWFLNYVLNSKYGEYQALRLVVGGGKGNLNTSDFKQYPLLLPPIQEQRKIVSICKAWDRVITITERLIKNNKQQKKALTQKLLEGSLRLLNSEGKPFDAVWKELKISDICEINPKKSLEPKNGLVSFIPMNAVSENAKLLRTETKHYSEVSKGFTSFINGDTLVAKITPCFENGKGAQVNNLENGIGFGSTEFHVLRAKKNICSQFIYFLTNTSAFRVRGKMNMQGSAGHKRVTTDYIKVYKVKVPTLLEEQQKISSVLSNADKETELLEQQLSDLKLEKKALMQQLLTGNRRVNI